MSRYEYGIIDIYSESLYNTIQNTGMRYPTISCILFQMENLNLSKPFCDDAMYATDYMFCVLQSFHQRHSIHWGIFNNRQ